MFNFTVAENHDTAPKVEGVVVEFDSVLFENKKYPIADKCKSIRGCTVYYTDGQTPLEKPLKTNIANLTPDQHIRDAMAKVLFNKRDYVKFMSNRAYDGENTHCRPYRPGLKVRGILINNEVVIHHIYHNETTTISTNKSAQVIEN